MSFVHMAAAIPIMNDDAFWTANSWELFADPTDFQSDNTMATTTTTSASSDQLVMNKANIKINDIQVEGFFATSGNNEHVEVASTNAEAMILEPIRMEEQEPEMEMEMEPESDPFEDALEVFMADDFLVPTETSPFDCVDTMDIDMEEEDDSEEDQEPFLESLHCTMTDLEREFFARAASGNEQVNVTRTKRVRSLERVQRQWCGLALDNYKLRMHSTTFQQRAGGLLQDLDGLLACETTKQVIMEALRSAEGQQAIANARTQLYQAFQEESNVDANTSSWTLTQSTDASNCAVLKTDKFVARQSVQVSDLATRTFSQFTKPESALDLTTQFRRPTRMQVLEQLGEHEFLVLYDLVEVEDDKEEDIHVDRSVALVGQKVDEATHAIGVGCYMLPASLWTDKLPALSLLQYREHGGLWLTFAEDAKHDAVAIGIRKALDKVEYSPEQVRTRHVRMLQRVMQAEALVLLPTTWL